MTIEQEIQLLEQQIEELRQQQITHSQELFALRSELLHLTEKVRQGKQASGKESVKEEDVQKGSIPQPESVPHKTAQYPDYSSKSAKKQAIPLDIEKYIGENIISKVGIVATLIGIGIGVKYSIDHNLITPFMRVLLAYAAGIGLGVVAYNLHEKYKHLSALLFGGSVATIYFVTFAAYDFYQLIPLPLATLVMLCCTLFTTITAVRYQQQPIAILGLIGAYAIPPLLSTGNNSLLFLSYISLVNLGALFLVQQQRWWNLLFSTLAGTWCIFTVWMFTTNTYSNEVALALSFSSLWFVLFQASFYLFRYTSNKDQRFFLVLINTANAMAYYLLGYIILDSKYNTFSGAFTLANSCFYALFFLWMYKFSSESKAANTLLLPTVGLAILFLTLAIPVEFNGNWVTLLWAAEAAIGIYTALYFGKSNARYVAYVLLALSLISLIGDIQDVHAMFTPTNPESKITAFFNIYFTTYLFVLASFIFATYSLFRKQEHIQKEEKTLLFILTAIAGYGIFTSEISLFWEQIMSEAIYLEERGLLSSIASYTPLAGLWITNFTLLYWGVFSLLVRKYNKEAYTGIIFIALNIVLLSIFCMLTISANRELLQLTTPDSPFVHGLLLFRPARYISFLIACINLVSLYYWSRTTILRYILPTADTASHIVLICITSSILIELADTSQSLEFTKTFGLTILWGIYALFMIIGGIKFQHKHIRMAAIALLGITIVKLLFDDLADVETIAKTFLFIIIGLVLLVISFLYNKYRNAIAKENPSKEQE